MRKHARFSPSASKRYLNCPPSLVLEEQFPETTSEFAEEGTAGHALAEHLIKKYLKIRTKRPTSDYYTDELVGAVDDYVEYVKEQIDRAKKECREPIISVEEKVDVGAYIDGCFGTADMVIITDNRLHIIDLKLGKGVPVYAEENTQLMIYALGVMDSYEMLFDFEKVVLTIFPFFDANALDSGRFLFGVAKPKIEIYDGDKTISQFLMNAFLKDGIRRPRKYPKANATVRCRTLRGGY